MNEVDLFESSFCINGLFTLMHHPLCVFFFNLLGRTCVGVFSGRFMDTVCSTFADQLYSLPQLYAPLDQTGNASPKWHRVDLVCLSRSIQYTLLSLFTFTICNIFVNIMCRNKTLLLSLLLYFNVFLSLHSMRLHTQEQLISSER